MPISSVASVTVTRATRTPTRVGFGTLAVFAYHTHNVDVYREYSDLSEMVTDGFSTFEPAYLMASSAFQQNPRPESILVVRALAGAQTSDVVITDATEGNHIKISVRAPSTGVWTDIDYTILPAASTTTVATAVELLIDAVTGVDSSPSTDTITITPTTATESVFFRDLVGCTLLDNTPDPGYSAGLTTLINSGADFFWVATEHNSPLAVTAMRVACETARRVYGWQTQNSVEKTASGTLFAAQLALSPDFGFGLFADDASEYQQAGAMAWAGTRDPGSYTLSAKTIKGATPVLLTTTESGYLDADNANYYQTIANGIKGVQGTNGGGVMSGGEFIDIIHGTEWWIARVREAILGVIASVDKVDYTDEGVRQLVAAVEGVNKQGIRNRLFASATTTAEPVADQSAGDKGARHYPGIRVVATYAGAIHKTSISALFSL
jgi:hypothetical protein